MDAKAIRRKVEAEIADRWNETNAHRVNLATALVGPQQMKMIERLANDTIVDVWLVLKEVARGDGYLIFYREDLDTFGLASAGFPHDSYPVICGYYGDFWTTFQGM